MIEQIHYATTSRYNFPQISVGVPSKIIELSLNSMSEIRDKCFQPWIDLGGQQMEGVEGQEGAIEVCNGDSFSLISPLEPIPDDSPVVAVDASSIKVGETESGIICAVRGAVVWYERKCYRYLRIGPFPFHITEENRKKVLSVLGQSQSIIFNSGIQFLVEVQSRLCSALERWIQTAISDSVSNGIILLDGALSSRFSNSGFNSLEQILRKARDNSNVVLSFSKTSTVRVLGRKITDLITRQSGPCLLEINDGMLSASSRNNMRLLGKVYVVKLNERGYAFRVDVDGALPREIQVMAVQRLLGNDLTFQGYPETLRLAHIFSTFTASDVIGIQRFIAEEYGLKVVSWPDIRKALFGPFGTGGTGD